MFRSLTAHRMKNVLPHAASILLLSQGIRALTEVFRSCLSTGSVYRGLPVKNKLPITTIRQKCSIMISWLVGHGFDWLWLTIRLVFGT